MKTVKLTPKASEDLENIWHYGWQHFGEIQADRYINHLSEIFSIMSANNIGHGYIRSSPVPITLARLDLNWVNTFMPYRLKGILSILYNQLRKLS
ncbi:hypothetical protein LTSEWAN_4509 [Salmonella enterica subsp. enterica serovar Wandsworth str. A4-580]|uniref:Type II toxin-antitoxin system RelE/ParE family toxin n=1 Tax=Salmonella enterica subsp. enterica serovar Wandsworth str. A4-580 TaxID=913086 RepID=G5SG72_SALET|nr:hypothetical protein LTSEWAN_4509 [Salmonella enterica subsp. enterica serovar Wandsworth str. A4-580]